MNAIEYSALFVLRSYIRYVPISFGKWFIWSKILDPYFNSRRMTFYAKTRFGICHEISFPDLIQKFIFYFGVWEPTITRYVMSNLSKGDIFIDVGANVGYFTCLAAKLIGGGGCVCAVEASPSLFEVLNDNIRRNKVKNVIAINKAVYDEARSITIYKASDDNLGASTVYRGNRDPQSLLAESEIEADTLLKIVGAERLFNARIIKIDVEGAEWLVFKGFSDQLERFSDRTDWLIEFAPDAVVRQGGNVADMVNRFAECGYSAYRIENKYSPGWYMEGDFGKYLSALPADLGTLRDVLFTKTIPEALAGK